MLKSLQTCTLLSALTLAFSFVSVQAQPLEASAQSAAYVADTTQQVTLSSLTSGARYLFCQLSEKTSKYEILDGSMATTITKQIPFCSPDYSALADLQSGVSSQAFRFVSLENVTGQSGFWFIRRNSDGYYFSSNGSSDLVFSSDSTYSSTTRTYFVPSAGSASNTIRFSVYNDTSLFLGTKAEDAYFDTWHDQTNSVAAKDFILYRVYDQSEEAANYAASFVSTIGSVCSADGNTALQDLDSAWAEMEIAWGKLSSSAQGILTSVTADPDPEASITAQCKAKYLYIVSKYSLDDFMGLKVNGLVSIPFVSEKKDDGRLWVVAALSFLSVFFGGFLAFLKKKRMRKE